MNSIALATKYQPLLDKVFKKASVTQDLEAKESAVKFDGSNTVKILKIKLPSLGSYSRNSGFKTGDIEATWQSWTLTQDRGREFTVDAMDDEETLNQTFGNACSEFIRTKVAPQVDTYRFGKLASTEGISKASGAITTGEEAISALRACANKMDADEVDEENRILYATSAIVGAIEDLETIKSRKVLERFAKIVKVPQSRFVTKTQYNAETEEIEPTADASNINFMCVLPRACQAVAKHTKLRIFLANGDEGTGANKNQKTDGHLFQYRLYHDIFVYENKVAGIYCPSAPASV